MKSIRIGTRNSALALWQAREVARHLQNNNYLTEIVPIVSSGDKNLNQPLYSLGITGVFTRDLDIALLNDEIDIAVHSLKDVPTQLPQNIEMIAYLERDFPQDILIRKESARNKEFHELKLATSSLRRRAFWLRNYPNAEFSDIRGNIQTRLQKLEDENFDATILSLAGIKRMKMEIDYEMLPLMISAPSQGVIAVAGHTDKPEINEILKQINHQPTQICVEIERNFLSTLEGGCTAPIGAFAEIIADQIRFKAALCSLDGKNCIAIDESFEYGTDENFGEKYAKVVLENGGKELMAEIKSQI
ncbi:hydroxymethylbilane synthase [Chryseobacterium indologenes]|uniref:hydroxymethylbilane synthase n=1 Tax=Chryseobacterium indologenes TaxID=253 RepID=UPI000BFCA25B|nr:hydroxymethylbilane synthase [Chryseobacterium indologenes]ATN07417.1 hydroxymethylbilane synthase [Chryseobacterium indologenes]AYY83845.1 hydroxymethylbilane synthase [Chryseobacterium indologenes]AYZ37662.1 hydroxymethylbilane synthase [Chryseobacterium indologenes]MBF6646550.1 hydroxymethylbilane synthase [Chryseobacterium indologenes]MBU3046969.1 hydroxymethylbilane synthase [Chryseobacterium indologenes]